MYGKKHNNELVDLHHDFCKALIAVTDPSHKPKELPEQTLDAFRGPL